MDDNVESRRGLAERMYVDVCVRVVSGGKWQTEDGPANKGRWLGGGSWADAAQVALAIAGKALRGQPGRAGHLRAEALKPAETRAPREGGSENPLIRVPRRAAASASERTYLLIPATGPRAVQRVLLGAGDLGRKRETLLYGYLRPGTARRARKGIGTPVLL